MYGFFRETSKQYSLRFRLYGICNGSSNINFICTEFLNYFLSVILLLYYFPPYVFFSNSQMESRYRRTITVAADSSQPPSAVCLVWRYRRPVTRIVADSGRLITDGFQSRRHGVSLCVNWRQWILPVCGFIIVGDITRHD